jgi:hypothetical protein
MAKASQERLLWDSWGAGLLKFALALATVLLVAGCAAGGTGQQNAPTSRWPIEWASDVCLAELDAGEAIASFGTALDDAKAYDVDGTNKALTDTNDKAQSAGALLSGAPTWKPGSSLVTYMNGETSALRKAANLLKIAIANNDASAVQQASKELDVVYAQQTRANDAASAIGFSCS